MSENNGTRERLIEAAIAIIETDGESAINVTRVVEQAGFTRPVLYRHFANGDALIVHAQTERYRRALEFGNDLMIATAESMKTPEEFGQVLRTWISSFGSAEGEARRSTRIEVLGSSISRPDLRQHVIDVNRAHVKTLSDFFARATDRGLMSPRHDPASLAVWAIGLLLSRHLVDIDTASFDPDGWSAITDSVAAFLIGWDRNDIN